MALSLAPDVADSYAGNATEGDTPMHGAHWGWVALIGSIAVLFTASNYQQTTTNKITTELRKELRSAGQTQERLVQQKEHALQQRDFALNQAENFSTLAGSYEQQLQAAQNEIHALKSSRDSLRKELASVAQDRQQLQQTVASLQTERSQTKRNVEQLRQGLHQLLSQADTVASTLAGPPPGFVQIAFDETPIAFTPARKPCSQGAYYPDEPTNDAQ